MEDGFQIIEPKGLVLLYANPLHFDFAVAILHWLVAEVRSILGNQLDNVELKVICVEYMGKYPALGAHYKTVSPSDMGPLIESAIEDILRGRRVKDLIDFIGHNPTSWHEVTERIIGHE